MNKDAYENALKIADKAEQFGDKALEVAAVVMGVATKVKVLSKKFADDVRTEADKKRASAVWSEATDKEDISKVVKEASDYLSQWMNKEKD